MRLEAIAAVTGYFVGVCMMGIVCWYFGDKEIEKAHFEGYLEGLEECMEFIKPIVPIEEVTPSWDVNYEL